MKPNFPRPICRAARQIGRLSPLMLKTVTILSRKRRVSKSFCPLKKIKRGYFLIARVSGSCVMAKGSSLTVNVF
jgi:hypothetical protein